MENLVLQVKNLSTSFLIKGEKTAVVSDISFDLYEGKTVAIVGESGCGKSMLAHSLLRILPTHVAIGSEGEVLYKGKNLLKVSEREMRSIRGSKIAMIFQNPGSALNPVYTIGEQLLEVVDLHLKLDPESALERILKVLTEAGIPSPIERLNDYPHQLSGGMKQRIMIAMALICEPDILIADEPTTALDVTIQAQVLDLIKELQKKKKMAVLLITHDMGVVAEMADDVIVMYAAQNVEKAPVNTIFENMAHPYTKGLFLSRLSLEKGENKLEVIKGSVPSLGNFPSGCHFHPRCPYVMKECLTGKIPDFTIGDQHQVMCLLYGSKDNE